jgi:hypothetical protein
MDAHFLTWHLWIILFKNCLVVLYFLKISKCLVVFSVNKMFLFKAKTLSVKCSWHHHNHYSHSAFSTVYTICTEVIGVSCHGYNHTPEFGMIRMQAEWWSNSLIPTQQIFSSSVPYTILLFPAASCWCVIQHRLPLWGGRETARDC